MLAAALPRCVADHPGGEPGPGRDCLDGSPHQLNVDGRDRLARRGQERDKFFGRAWLKPDDDRPVHVWVHAQAGGRAERDSAIPAELASDVGTGQIDGALDQIGDALGDRVTGIHDRDQRNSVADPD